MNEHASLNRFYRLIWNETSRTWVAVAETKTGRRKGRGRAAARALSATAASLALLLPGLAAAQAAPAPLQLPTGGQVSAGQASLSQTVTATAATLTVQQTSARAAINWQGFDIGAQASVQFNQPNAQSVTLNRVVGDQPSRILGRMTAPGQVFVLNPQGVLFGRSAAVEVGGLVATTHAMSDADFMAGATRFSRAGATGRVVNEGTLRAALGGYIALLAPEVRNEGVVVAQRGTVALGAGEHVTLDFGSGGVLGGIRVDAGDYRALVDNRQAVEVGEGRVIFSARAAEALMARVVNQGRVSASSLTERGGRILLEGGDITLAAGSSLDASGAAGGGTVHVGGGWQGASTPAPAERVTMAAGADVRADARARGDGGEIVLWSDVHGGRGHTVIEGGRLSARGAADGRGGRIETSGATLTVGDVKAEAGPGGQWLLDPVNIVVATSGGTVTPATIQGTLDTGTSMILDSTTAGPDAGTITVRSPITKTAGGDATLSLHAAGDIDIGNGQTGVAITSTQGALNLVLNAGAGSVRLGRAVTGQGVTLATLGGHVWIGGGALDGSTWKGLAVGSGAATASTAARSHDGAVEIHQSTIDTRAADGSGGSVSIQGQGVLRPGGAAHLGVRVRDSVLQAGTGDVQVTGGLVAQNAVTPTEAYGVDLIDSSLAATSGSVSVTGSALSQATAGFGVMLQNSTVTTDSGALRVEGELGTTARARGDGVALANWGVPGKTVALRTGSGTLALIGRNGATNAPAGAGVGIYADGVGSRVDVVTQTGRVQITAEHESNVDTSVLNQGLWLSASNTNGVIALGGDGAGHGGGTALDIQASHIRSTGIGAGNLRLLGTGQVTIDHPLGFWGALAIDGAWTFGSQHAGLTIGHSGNSAALTFAPTGTTTVSGDVRFISDTAGAGGSAINIQTPIVAGGSLTATTAGMLVVEGNLSGRGIALRAGDRVWLGTNVSSLAAQDGGILIATRTGGAAGGGFATSLAGTALTLSATGAGGITIGGGDADGSGAAIGSATDGTILDGIRFAGNVSATTEGGAITLRGRSGAGAGSHSATGVIFNGTATLTSGTGQVRIEGSSVSGNAALPGQGVDFVGRAVITTGSSAADAIAISGDARGSLGDVNNDNGSGVRFAGLDNTLVATGSGGGIHIEGWKGGSATKDVTFRGGEILAASGPITLAARQGGALHVTEAGATTFIGARDGSAVTASTSGITLRGARFYWNNAYLNTTGQLDILPATDSGSFAAPFYSSWLKTNQVGTDTSRRLTGLTIGGNANEGSITVDNDLTVNGPVSLLAPAGAGSVAINRWLTLTADGAPLLVKAGRDITVAAEMQLKTARGALTLWSDADADANGRIAIGANAGLGTYVNGDPRPGGSITLAGGAADAQGRPAGAAVGTGADAGVEIGVKDLATQQTQLASAGGDIRIVGASTGTGAGVAAHQAAIIDAGGGTIDVQGSALGGTSAGAGVRFYGGAYGVSSNPDNIDRIELRSAGGSTTTSAIRVTGSTAATGATGSAAVRTDKALLNATGDGGIRVEGIATATNLAGSLSLTRTDVLSARGAIDLVANGGPTHFGGSLGALPSASASAAPVAIVRTRVV